MRIAGNRSCPFQQQRGAVMDQPIRSRRKDLPADHPKPYPGIPPYPVHPDLDNDSYDVLQNTQKNFYVLGSLVNFHNRAVLLASFL